MLNLNVWDGVSFMFTPSPIGYWLGKKRREGGPFLKRNQGRKSVLSHFRLHLEFMLVQHLQFLVAGGIHCAVEGGCDVSG